ncbi:MAG: peptidylprolyl isomerase [Candidatus Thermoplasmatota archaeon]
MALKDGDVIRLDYTLFVDGKLVETNQEEVAKKNDIFREGKRYQSLVVALGQHQIIPGLESHIRSHGQAGKSVKVDLAAADAYGERKADKVKDVPMAQFKSQKVQPQVGLSVNLGGERGIVTRVAGGRVRVDLNHDLAGKPLTYEYTVRELISDDAAKVDAVLANLFQPGSYKVAVTKDEVAFDVPDAAKFDESWTRAKFAVVSQIRAVAGRRSIKLVETFPPAPEGGSKQPGHEGHNHD